MGLKPSPSWPSAPSSHVSETKLLPANNFTYYFIWVLEFSLKTLWICEPTEQSSTNIQPTLHMSHG